MALTRETYLARIIDDKIDHLLMAFGAVCLEGPKWCGKTWTSLNHANSVFFLADPANNFQNRRIAEMSPGIVLQGETPRLIDEWQEVPALWDAIRFEVDRTGQKGSYLLTGSATPNEKGILHSGTGRITSLRMRPMSLFESGESNGSVSLEELYSSDLPPVPAQEATLQQLIDLTIRGGWPGSLDIPSSSALEVPRGYLQNVIDDDVHRIDGITRDRRKIELLLRSLARNKSTIVTNRTLQRDVLEEHEESIDDGTISKYLDILRRLFIIEDIPAFSTNLRSSARIGKTPKKQFCDPSLAAAALGATPERLLNDLNTFGFLFESLCMRDLRVYADSIDGRVYHYRDAKQREIDAIIELPDGRWGAIEIKLGTNQVEAAAQQLLRIISSLETDPTFRSPAFLCVLTGLGSIAYTRDDGVAVVPITALRP